MQQRVAIALPFKELGRVANASDDYEKSERTLSNAMSHIAPDELKRNYAEMLKKLREHHVILLKQTDQAEAAANLEQRLAASVE